jgi:hypothetical protein
MTELHAVNMVCNLMDEFPASWQIYQIKTIQ